MPAIIIMPRTMGGIVFHGRDAGGASIEVQPVAADVVTVKVAVAAFVPEILTGEVEPKLRTGGDATLAGLVIAAVRVTAPVNPPAGVMVTVEVLPLVAPGLTLTDVLAIEKLGA